ncbi:LysR family transcriptional regulator [Ferrimonas aestuarii]|uniref:LysR family transcriptional regulator n=1 Tax=Ferrimonas aestuarii TaxID=2569539 RepID=A0A4U1BI42_9GAMM|nr:LysR family transcriptional regulator [Ferrimonas aestuarii]TKB50756.1 LysR family transcriptional regulator [Ferrimonas aestuarii]
MSAHTDLNLLRTLLTLIEEQSVSRTAERLFLSQSAVSKQLTKLRQQFNDPLFKRHPKGLKPTPRARILEPKLRHWLALSEEIIEPQGFDPSTSQRQFRIALNETSFVTLLPKFLAPLMKAAPGIKLKTLDWEAVTMAGLCKGRADLALFARDVDERAPWAHQIAAIPKNLCYQPLVEERHICLVRQGHPVLEHPWDLSVYLTQQHVKMDCEGSEHWLLDRVLAEQGHTLEVGMVTSDFHSAAVLTQHSDMVFTCTQGFGNQVADTHDLVKLPLPVKLQPSFKLIAWPQSIDADPAHRWLREFVAQYCLEEAAEMAPRN